VSFSDEPSAMSRTGLVRCDESGGMADSSSHRQLYDVLRKKSDVLNSVVEKAEASKARVTAASGKAVQCAMRAWSCARYREKERK
jgi:hypothetical protein